jgi:twitching motility protein PilT
MIDHINANRSVNVVTIEDPIEIIHHDNLAMINQREVGVDTGNFAVALRGAMRQDPDVILVGEMRDAETVKAALAAAETGHFVMSTLHTVDAQETVNRIIDFFPPHEQQQIRFALAGALKGILCQRLVPRAGGKGRVAAMEIAISTGRIADAITDANKTSTIMTLVSEGGYYGMQTFDQHLIVLFQQGAITLADAIATSTSPHDLLVEMRRLGLAN